MKKTDAWMPFYVGDYLADTGRLSTEGHGAYLLLILDYWRNGPPPDEDESLAAIARMPIQRWQKLRPLIIRFFQPGDGVWKHKRIDAEKDKANGISSDRSAAGKASAEAKRKQRLNKNSTSVETNTQQTPTPSQSQSQEPLQQQPELPAEPARDEPSAAAEKSGGEKEDDSLEIPEFLRRTDAPKPNPARDIIAAFDAVLVEIFGTERARPFPHNTDFVTASRWLEAGAVIAFDIEPQFRAVMARMKAQGQEPPRSMRYFDEPVRTAVKDRLAGGKADEALAWFASWAREPEALTWLARLGALKRGKWDEAAWGPEPGVQRCRMPERLAVAYLAGQFDEYLEGKKAA